MRVLYVSNYRDPTGWGQSARDYILALDAAGVDVVCRPVKLSREIAVPPERVLQLESRPSRGCDVVVQHVLPHRMDYNGRLVNVGLFFTETSDVSRSSWADRVNCMDAAVVCNRQSRDACLASGVTVPLHVVPLARDVREYDVPWRGHPQVEDLKAGGQFVFYTAGEMVRRKNLPALLRAFHAEFRPEEPVSLVVKTGLPGMPPSECRLHVEADCERVKRALKLYAGSDPRHYKQEVVLAERLSDAEVSGLHRSCDCFVQTSFGEAWSIPAFDAMGHGKTPIVPDWGGYREYVDADTGWPVACREEQVHGINDSIADLYTGHETWGSVCVLALRRAMREAYEDSGLRLRKARAGRLRANDFSHAAVGRLLRSALEAACEHKRGLEGASRRLPA